MKNLFGMLGILSLMASGCQNNTDPQKHVFIAFGQSNMQGPGQIKAEDKEGIPERFLSLNVVAGNYGGGTRTQGEWYRAVPPNIIVEENLINWQGLPIGLSPVDYFGRTLAANTPEYITIGVIAVANGDLALASFHPTKAAEYFAPGSGGEGREPNRPSDTERQGWDRYTGAGYDNLYHAIISNARIAQEQGGIIKGIIFHQGESGRGLTYSSWGDMLKKIYNNILSDLGLEPNSIPIIVGQTFDGGSGNTGGALANDEAIRGYIPNAHVIPTAGLAGRLNPDGATIDNVHFGTEGIRDLGTLYGKKMLDLIYR